jgi:hypothetical protein
VQRSRINLQPFWAMPFQICVALLILLAGCGKNATEQNLVSDANGFFCRACKLKFYTEAPVFAERCPACKSSDLAAVLGFQCYKDQHLNLTPQGPKSLACEKCQAEATGIKMPSAAQLQAWGAVRKSKAEVGGR